MAVGLPLLLMGAAGAARGYVDERYRQDTLDLRREDQRFKQERALNQEDRASSAEAREAEKFQVAKRQTLSAEEEKRRSQFLDSVGKWALAYEQGDQFGINSATAGLNQYRDKDEFPTSFATVKEAPLNDDELVTGNTSALMFIDDEGQPMETGGRPLIFSREKIKRLADAYLQKTQPDEYGTAGDLLYVKKGRHAGAVKRLPTQDEWGGFKYGTYNKRTGEMNFAKGTGGKGGGRASFLTEAEKRGAGVAVGRIIAVKFGGTYNDKLGTWTVPPGNREAAGDAWAVAVEWWMEGAFESPETAAAQASKISKLAMEANIPLRQYIKLNSKKNKAPPGGLATAKEYGDQLKANANRRTVAVGLPSGGSPAALGSRERELPLEEIR